MTRWVVKQPKPPLEPKGNSYDRKVMLKLRSLCTGDAPGGYHVMLGERPTRKESEESNEEDTKAKRFQRHPIPKQLVNPKGPTTVMLQNVPHQLDRDEFCRKLHQQGFEQKYDFLYLPINPESSRNYGYAFINLNSAEATLKFVEQFHNVDATKALPGHISSKVSHVNYAKVQGREANMHRFKGSEFPDQWCPVFIDEEGDHIPYAVVKRGQRKKSEDSWLNPEAQEFVPVVAGAPDFWSLMMMSPILDAKDNDNKVPELALEGDSPNTKRITPEMLMAVAAGKIEETMEWNMKVVNQVEFYFSPENVPHDHYLRSLMDAQGWVDLKHVVQFGRMKRLGADEMCTAQLLMASEALEVKQARRRPISWKVRIKDAELRANCGVEPDAKKVERSESDVSARVH
eukprot:TRINITY_DN8174_c0_g1_i5.p1 TRINITY_DN8174_c0_g1~~TRINITY_DN8174_c0_g1_i5.p1  ORF type:complete len:401 (+),score=74.69 TRINITY_DN8174_c0_g1_i5:141-1343(+)